MTRRAPSPPTRLSPPGGANVGSERQPEPRGGRSLTSDRCPTRRSRARRGGRRSRPRRRTPRRSPPRSRARRSGLVRTMRSTLESVQRAPSAACHLIESRARSAAGRPDPAASRRGCSPRSPRAARKDHRSPTLICEPAPCGGIASDGARIGKPETGPCPDRGRDAGGFVEQHRIGNGGNSDVVRGVGAERAARGTTTSCRNAPESTRPHIQPIGRLRRCWRRSGARARPVGRPSRPRAPPPRAPASGRTRSSETARSMSNGRSAPSPIRR